MHTTEMTVFRNFLKLKIQGLEKESRVIMSINDAQEVKGQLDAYKHIKNVFDALCGKQ